MKLRVIDYVGNKGGGLRFTIEMIRGLNRIAPDISIELVSDGLSFKQYKDLVDQNGLCCDVRQKSPDSVSKNGWVFTIPNEELLGCDKIWLPWGHRHHINSGVNHASLLVTLHDLLVITVPILQEILQELASSEKEVTSAWLNCNADVVVSSFHTRDEITRVFGAPQRQVHIASLAGSHAKIAENDVSLLPPGLREKSFIFCPFNISPHKNHEVLFHALSRWETRLPTVLTGAGTDLGGSLAKWILPIWRLVGGLGLRQPRAFTLRLLAKRCGLRFGHDLHTIGYVSDATYYSLLQNCWAVVMPTLGEGGGSFPVEEALWLGKPVISADIPVMREQMRRLNADVLWFDPARPEELIERLEELKQNYDLWEEKFSAQISSMTHRTWDDTINEYLPLLRT